MEFMDLFVAGGKLIFNSLQNGNKQDIIELMNQDVIDMQVQVNEQIIIGNHIGKRKLVQYGQCLQIKFLSLNPNYKAQPNGDGLFICEQFTYQGKFLNGVFHDNTGEACLNTDQTERYIGMFKAGLRSGVGRLEVYNFKFKKWEIKQDGFWENNIFKEYSENQNTILKNEDVQLQNNKNVQLQINQNINRKRTKNLNNDQVLQEQKEKIFVEEIQDQDMQIKEFDYQNQIQNLPDVTNIKNFLNIGSLQQILKKQNKSRISPECLNNVQEIIIDLRNLKLNQSNLDIIQQILKFNESLQNLEINLQKNNLNEMKLLFLEEINKINKLQQLYLSLQQTNLQIQQINNFQFDNLQNLQCLRLNLNNNQIQNEGILILSQKIQNLHQLHDLYLSLNNCQIQNFSQICKSILNLQNLQRLSLNLDQNKLEILCFENLVICIQKLSKLEYLNLSLYNTNLQNQEAENIIDSIIQKQCLIETCIYLHGNQVTKQYKETLKAKINQISNQKRKNISI